MNMEYDWWDLSRHYCFVSIFFYRLAGCYRMNIFLSSDNNKILILLLQIAEYYNQHKCSLFDVNKSILENEIY